jgi:hypothetical protein
LTQVHQPRRAQSRRHGKLSGIGLANALVDALSPFGIRHIEMPATPERLWRAMLGAPR